MAPNSSKGPQVAIVTGSGSGLGRAYALDLVASGVVQYILINDANYDDAVAVCGEINGKYGGFTGTTNAATAAGPSGGSGGGFVKAVANGDMITGEVIRISKYEGWELNLAGQPLTN